MSPVRYSLRQLEYFVAIAEAGSLSGAAGQLRVSQSGLSQSLTDLERALGVQLAVRRKAHGVALTPTGTQVLRHARDLLRHSEDLANVASGGDSLRGVLQLGCYVTLAPTMLPPLLERFGELHPDLRIDFVEGTQDVLQRRLLDGVLDLAVLYDMEVLPEIERAVIDTALPHVLLAANHRLAGEPSVSLDDLAAEPMVLLDAPPSSHNTLDIFNRLGLSPQVRYRPSTFELARALVGRGMGYAFLVQRPANDRTYEGKKVAMKEISDDVGTFRVVLAWPKGTRLNQRAQAFVTFCQDRHRDRGSST